MIKCNIYDNVCWLLQNGRSRCEDLNWALVKVKMSLSSSKVIREWLLEYKVSGFPSVYRVECKPRQMSPQY